MLNLYLFYILI